MQNALNSKRPIPQSLRPEAGHLAAMNQTWQRSGCVSSVLCHFIIPGAYMTTHENGCSIARRIGNKIKNGGNSHRSCDPTMQWGTRQSQHIFRATDHKREMQANWMSCLIPTDSLLATRLGLCSSLDRFVSDLPHQYERDEYSHSYMMTSRHGNNFSWPFVRGIHRPNI